MVRGSMGSTLATCQCACLVFGEEEVVTGHEQKAGVVSLFAEAAG